MENARNDDVKKIASLIKDIQVAMMTTVEEDGSLRSRPMATHKEPFDGTLWFFTREHSGKVREIGHEHRVNISYAYPSDNSYVSISGLCRVVTDRAKIDELWSPMLKAWFPKGKEDPEIALLCVEADKAEYWDAPSSTMVKLIGLAKSLVTGKTYEPGDNKQVNLAGTHA